MVLARLATSLLGERKLPELGLHLEGTDDVVGSASDVVGARSSSASSVLRHPVFVPGSRLSSGTIGVNLVWTFILLTVMHI
jgi:hypothetical protein